MENELLNLIGELDDQLSLFNAEVNWYYIDGDIWADIKSRMEKAVEQAQQEVAQEIKEGIEKLSGDDWLPNIHGTFSHDEWQAFWEQFGVK